MTEEVMTRPEVVAMIVTVVLSLLGMLVAFAAAAKRWADSKFSPITKAVAETRQQTVNNHGPDGKDVNLRDQLDDIQEEMRSGFKRMDHQFGEVHDRQIRTESRLEGVESRAASEHERIWKHLNS